MLQITALSRKVAGRSEPFLGPVQFISLEPAVFKMVVLPLGLAQVQSNLLQKLSELTKLASSAMAFSLARVLGSAGHFDSAWSYVRAGKVHQTFGDPLATLNNVSWRASLKLVSFRLQH